MPVRFLRVIMPLAMVGALVGTLMCRQTATLKVERIDTPVPDGSLVPQMTATGDSVVLSWLEPRVNKGYRFRAAIRRGANWAPPSTIDDSPDIVMFSADLPGVVSSADGSLLAYWERADHRAKDDVYATTIQLAESRDRAITWSRRGPLNRDQATGEHSFVSGFPLEAGLGLVWLDAQHQTHVHTPAAYGKNATDEYLGAIGLRYARVGPDGRASSEFIDPITCECCPTSAAVTAKGPVVVYRDRLAPSAIRPEDVRYETETIRDITLVRLEGGRWTMPHRVYADNWTFNGCPDNGPAVAADGNRVAVAWWTGAGKQPHVSVAFSNDAGDTFAKPVVVNAGPAEGQVTVGLVRGGSAAVVGWLEDRRTWARWVDAEGHAGQPISLGPAPHHARLPKWIAENDAVVAAAWSEERNGRRSVHMARLSR